VYSRLGASRIGGGPSALGPEEGREVSAAVFASGEAEGFGPEGDVDLAPATEYTSCPAGLDAPEPAKGTAGGAPDDGNIGAVNVPLHKGHCIICPANWSAMVIIL